MRMTRRQRRMLVRLALAAAVATLIVTRYTSPRSLFKPVEDRGAAKDSESAREIGRQGETRR